MKYGSYSATDDSFWSIPVIFFFRFDIRLIRKPHVTVAARLLNAHLPKTGMDHWFFLLKIHIDPTLYPMEHVKFQRFILS